MADTEASREEKGTGKTRQRREREIVDELEDEAAAEEQEAEHEAEEAEREFGGDE